MAYTGYYTCLAKVAVQYSADTFVVNQSLVLRMSICGENRHFCKPQIVISTFKLIHTMDKKIILHIPHSSIKIPLYEGYLFDSTVLDKEILRLTDWFTDDLFYSDEDEMIIADFSRIFCDPERFTDDSQ